MPQVDHVVAINDDSRDFSADKLAERGIPVSFNGESAVSVAELRYVATELARTEYVLHQDADDYREHDSVNRHKNALQDYDLLITPYVHKTRTRGLEKDVISDIALGNIHTSALYFRRSSLLNLPAYTGLAWEYWVVYLAFVANLRIGFSKNPSAVYTGKGQLSARFGNEQKQARLKLLRKIMDEQVLNSQQYNLVQQAISSYDEKEKGSI